MREHVGLRRESSPPNAAPDGIRFAPQMICACTAIMPHIFLREADDRLSDIACARRPDRHRDIGGKFVIAEIVQFIRRPGHNDEQTDFPTIAFRSAAQDLTMDHADATPCEHTGPDGEETWVARTLIEIHSLARNQTRTRTAIKLLIWDKVLGLGTTDPLAGFASITSNLVASFYFAKRGFENIVGIIKR